MKRFFLIAGALLLFSNINLFASETSKSLVVSPKIDQQITDFFKLKISKSILRAASRQKGFHVILSSNPNQKIDIDAKYDLIVNVSKRKVGYQISSELYSLKKRSTILKVHKKQVNETSLLRDTEASIDLLFETYQKKKKKSQRAIKKIQEGTSKKINKVSNAYSQRKRSKAEMKLSQLIETLDGDSIDSSETRENLSKKSEDKDKAKEDESEEDIQKQTDSSQLKGKDPLKPQDALALLQKKYNLIALNVFSEENTSQGDFLGVTYNANYLGLEYEGGRTIFQSEFRLTYMFSYAKVFSDVTVQVPDYQVFGTGIKRPIWKDEFFLASWISYETLGFVNLPEFGEGLVAANNSIVWGDVEAQFGFLLGELGFLLRAGYGTTLTSTSDYKPTVSEGISGNRQKMALVISGLAEKINLIFRLQNRTLSGTSIDVDSQLIQGQVAYVF